MSKPLTVVRAGCQAMTRISVLILVIAAVTGCTVSLPTVTPASTLSPVSRSASTAPTKVAPTATRRTALSYEHILVPVDRFATLVQGTTMEELRGVWTGQVTSPNFTTLYPTQDEMTDLRALLGAPGPAVKPQPSAEAVADRLWEDQMGLGIVPFDKLMPRLRAIPLDGLSAVDNRLDQSQWPLAGRGPLADQAAAVAQGLHRLAGKMVWSNRDPGKLTVLVVTGTTAITRGDGYAIAQAGDPAFPARVIGPELAKADLTTISNEIPFVDDCPVDNSSGLMTFCAKPAWYATLELSGMDLVGLTGNHLLDYGPEAFTNTLAFYAGKGMKTYGGGANEEAARAPLIVEDHGNRLAFLGANQPGPVSDWAGPDSPGAARYDGDQLMADIKAIKPKVNLVLVELQWLEENANGDYQVEPIPGQAENFKALADAGADIVTGVQAHAPQALALQGKSIIFYGLGNLYFDQTFSWETRTGLVVRHAIYDGRLLNSELLVTVIDPNMQVRWATPQERVQVLESVYKASGW